jgi:two-component system, LytTR family, response regulator AlgR
MSEPLRVLVVDDELLARQRLCSLVAECSAPSAVVVADFAQPQLALDWLAQQPCDVVLLDIHMPGLDGLQLAQKLRELPGVRPAVIFVTAHAVHALQAFELAALDYLTKPVRRERLHGALARVAAQLRLAPQATPETGDPVVMVAHMGRKLRVPVREILYLKAELKYLTLRTAEHTFVVDGSLADFEQRLGHQFLRVHRNALIARRAMLLIERRQIGSLAGADSGDASGAEAWGVKVGPVGEWLAVSRRQVAAVKEAIAEDEV